MKKIIALLMCLSLIAMPALAEFDEEALRVDQELYSSFRLPVSADMVYRPVNQPYIGQVDEIYDGELVVYVEYITMLDAHATVIRLMASTVVFDDPLGADALRLTIGGKTYTLTVSREESEYDGLYMEDYTTVLVGEGLNMLKAIAQQKKDVPVPVELLCLDEVVFSGLVIIPGEEAAGIYDRWIDLGGKKQALKTLEEAWPCTVQKVK